MDDQVPKWAQELITEIAVLNERTDADGSVWWVPKAEDNSDYQRYLRWLATQPE